MKFVWILVLAVVAFRLLLRRWPWQRGGDVSRARARTRSRALLGVPAGAGRDEILDAHRRLLIQVHPDRGGSNEQVHEANAARDFLLGELAIGEKDRS